MRPLAVRRCYGHRSARDIYPDMMVQDDAGNEKQLMLEMPMAWAFFTCPQQPTPANSSQLQTTPDNMR